MTEQVVASIVAPVVVEIRCEHCGMVCKTTAGLANHVRACKSKPPTEILEQALKPTSVLGPSPERSWMEPRPVEDLGNTTRIVVAGKTVALHRENGRVLVQQGFCVVLTSLKFPQARNIFFSFMPEKWVGWLVAFMATATRQMERDREPFVTEESLK